MKTTKSRAFKHTALAVLLVTASYSWAQDAGDTSAIEAEIKVKELQLKLKEAEQKLKDAEIKSIDQAQREETARRLLARQADTERTLDAQASNNLSATDLAKDLQTFNKLKETFGDPPKIGLEGSVALTEGGTTQLLATRAGSAQASFELADLICKALAKAKVTSAYIAPQGFDEKLMKSSLLQAEVDGLVNHIATYKGQLEGIKTASAAGIVAGLNIARYLVGGAQELSKAIRSNYAYAVSSSSSRANLLEKSIAANCPGAVANVDLETSMRLHSDTSTFSTQADKLIVFLDEYDGKSSVLTATVAETTAKLTLERAKPEKDRNASVIEELDTRLKTQKGELGKLQLIEPASKRVKNYLDSLKNRDAQILEALTWANFAKWKNSPRLQLTVSSQDVQVTKTSAWTAQKISSASHIEVLYSVINSEGLVLVSGAATKSIVSPVLDMKTVGSSSLSCVTLAGVASCERTPVNATESAH
jgi:hypothetical protein